MLSIKQQSDLNDTAAKAADPRQWYAILQECARCMPCYALQFTAEDQWLEPTGANGREFAQLQGSEDIAHMLADVCTLVWC